MTEGVNLELSVDWPGGARVVRDYLAGGEHAAPFFGGHFASAEAYRVKAAAVAARFDRAARARAAAAVQTPPGADPTRLERFVDEGGFMVTTGQQPGLLGGPLFSVYKGLTAVRVAAALEELLEKPVVPLFWVASEDHDWLEANHTELVGVDNALHRVEVADPDPSVHPPLHRIRLGPDAAEARATLLAHLPDTDFSGPYRALVERALAPGRTLPEVFHEVLQELLGPLGLFFTDAADPALKEASAPVLVAELERAEEFEGVLSRTASELASAGYDLQVPLLDGALNLSLEGPAGRERLYREQGGFRLRTSGEHLSLDEVKARAADDPSALSPNVLLRPVVESRVFPTLSYVAGPGEIAYFAQVGAYFRAFGLETPVIHPRASVTVVESKIRKVMDKFGLDVADLARPFHEVAGDIARDDVPPDLKKGLGSLRGTVAKGVADLQKQVGSIDPTLKGPVQHVRSQAFAALDDLEKKIVHALKRENEIALAQLEKAQLHLFPHGKPQERVVNAFYYLARYGGAFLDEVYGRIQVNPE